MPTITLLYAGLLGALMAVLSIRVPMRRRALEVPFGDGGDEALATRIRAFGNFTEYVPMILLLLALLEMQGAPPALLHGLGVPLVGARVLHALSYRARSELTGPEKLGRAVSAMTTWLVLCVGSAAALVLVR
jgi:uncharacterized membrane protein YecN with MAPEG domain